MIVARVIGTVWSTVKEANLTGAKLLLVQDVNASRTTQVTVAVDAVDAGIGDTVLVVHEGGSARLCIGRPDAPVNAAAIAFVDSAEGYANE